MTQTIDKFIEKIKTSTKKTLQDNFRIELTSETKKTLDNLNEQDTNIHYDFAVNFYLFDTHIGEARLDVFETEVHGAKKRIDWYNFHPLIKFNYEDGETKNKLERNNIGTLAHITTLLYLHKKRDLDPNINLEYKNPSDSGKSHLNKMNISYEEYEDEDKEGITLITSLRSDLISAIKYTNSVGFEFENPFQYKE